MRFSKAFVALSAPFLLTSAAPAYKRADATDLLVVKFALALNQLESAFYDEALAKFKPADFLAAGFSTADVPLEQYKGISADEKAHIAFLEDALRSLGDVPVAGCKFDFSSVLGDATTMSAVSRVFENVGVSAFIGAAALLSDKNILGAAAGVLSIESRHSTIANVLNGGSSIPQAFDMGLTPSSVLALAGGFISGCDFGIPANAAMTTAPKAPGVGTKLEFTSPGIDKAKAAGQTLTCHILTGGDVASKPQPIDNCLIPAGINGPAYVYITNNAEPLSANPQAQCTTCIAAGPALIFVDTEIQALSSLTRNTGGKAIGADPAAGAPSGSTPGSTTPGGAAPAAPGGGVPTGSTPQNSKAGSPSTPGLSGFDNGVVVHGSFSIPKSQAGIAPAAPAPASSAPPSSASAASGAGATGRNGALVLPSGAALSPVST